MSALAEVQRRLQSTNALLAEYRHALNVPTNQGMRASLAFNIRSLETLRAELEDEFIELTSLQGMDVYRYRLLDTGDTPMLGAIAEAWSKFQNLFGVVYKSLWPEPDDKKSPPRPVPQLGYSYAFPGSVGVVVTLPKGGENLMLESPTDDASQIVFDLIESRNIQHIARKLGPQPIAALNEWLDIHVKNNYGIALDWRSKNEVKRKTEIRSPQLAVLQEQIASSKITETKILSAWLDGVWLDKDSTAKGKFRVKTDGGETIEGTFDGVITPEHTVSLPARYTFTIERVSNMLPKRGKTEEENLLRDIKPIE